MSAPITAAMLYDLVQCPQRPAMDLFGVPAKCDEINAFGQLPWEKGSAYEHALVDGLQIVQPLLDQRDGEVRDVDVDPITPELFRADAASTLR